MAFTPITVTRTYETADGVPAEGTVQFKPTAAMVNATTVISAAVAEPLDADGELSITVAANDDPATEPEGVGYTVTEFLAGQPARSYVVVVPSGAVGGTVDLSTLTVLAAAPTLQDLSKISEASDFDGTGAAVGQVLAATQVSPLEFALAPGLPAAAGDGELAQQVGGEWVGADPSRLQFPALLLRASDFWIGAGSPTKEMYAGRFEGWTLLNSGAPRINTTFTPQLGQSVVDIDVLWAQDNTSSGDVKFRLQCFLSAFNETPGTLTPLPDVIAATRPTGGNFERRTRLVSGFDVTKSVGSEVLLTLERRADDVEDTLADDLHIRALVISPSAQGQSVVAQDGVYYTHNEHHTVADATAGYVYVGSTTTNGDTQISQIDTDTNAVSTFTLHSRLEADDHTNPAPFVRTDGRIIAFYCKHSVVNDPIYYRISTNPGDITAWGAEQQIVLPVGNQPCYPMPAQAGSRIYLFFRNLLARDYVYSDDDGATWSAPAPLFRFNSGWRGYVNYHVSADGRVDFMVGDDNPNPAGSNTSIHHCYLVGGNLYQTDGTLIAALGAGITPSQMTHVHLYTDGDGDLWGYDVQRGTDGRPILLYASFGTGDAGLADHRYWRARWTGSAWVRNPITYAGPSPYDVDGTGVIGVTSGEPRYSGGLSMLPSDPSVVYLSRWVGRQMEVERWVTADQGATWTSEPVTSQSPVKQFRPQCPEHHFAGAPEVVWLSGRYTTMDAYQTRVVYQPQS